MNDLNTTIERAKARERKRDELLRVATAIYAASYSDHQGSDPNYHDCGFVDVACAVQQADALIAKVDEESK